MTDVYPLHDLGLQVLEQTASLHAELLAEHGPAAAVMAAIDERGDDADKDNVFRPSGPQARFAGPAFNAAFPQDDGFGAEGGLLRVRTDEAGLYGF